MKITGSDDRETFLCRFAHGQDAIYRRTVAIISGIIMKIWHCRDMSCYSSQTESRGYVHFQECLMDQCLFFKSFLLLMFSIHAVIIHSVILLDWGRNHAELFLSSWNSVLRLFVLQDGITGHVILVLHCWFEVHLWLRQSWCNMANSQSAFRFVNMCCPLWVANTNICVSLHSCLTKHALIEYWSNTVWFETVVDWKELVMWLV